MTDLFQGPVKRSMMIAGHATSISLEPVFWDALRAAAEAERLPVNALVARIDADRIQAPHPPNLGSAIRLWLFDQAKEATGENAPEGPPNETG
ncbi:ribbon-helix-helix domain-containing protein [Sphingosinicella rhizophila]|uniref:ribbon-helix-helix domain-containing protein n=1 Tax=Sphingosinicella rhizophila TaxID=3050082 RepID=UPI00396574C8